MPHKTGLAVVLEHVKPKYHFLMCLRVWIENFGLPLPS